MPLTAAEVRAAMEAARGLGVVFDIGHGMAGFGFDVGRAMLDGGLPPDVISSYVHVPSANGPAVRRVVEAGVKGGLRLAGAGARDLHRLGP